MKITEIDANNVIVEFRVPQKYLTHTLGTANLNSRFKLKVIAVKSQEKKGLLSRDQIKTTLMPDDNYIFRENDIIVLMGALDDMKRFAAD